MTGSGEQPVIEIRPLAPDGRRPSPGLAAVLRKSFLRADPQAGELVMTEARPLTWRPPREWVLALPATGKPDAVTAVCLASYSTRAGFRNWPLWQMLLLDRDGRVLAAGRARDQRQGRAMWPPGLLSPLRRVGIDVLQERFATQAELGRAHPQRGE